MNAILDTNVLISGIFFSGPPRQILEAWIPEIRELSTANRELVHAMASFEMWHRLREVQGLSQTEVVEIMVDELLGRLM